MDSFNKKMKVVVIKKNELKGKKVEEEVMKRLERFGIDEKKMNMDLMSGGWDLGRNNYTTIVWLK